MENRTDPIPTAVTVVFAIVLREAVTNILRHSSAQRCILATATGPDAVRLSITNDGLPEPPAGGDRDSGLANLAAGLDTAGGRLDTRHGGGRFALVAQLSIPSPAADVGVTGITLRRLFWICTVQVCGWAREWSGRCTAAST